MMTVSGGSTKPAESNFDADGREVAERVLSEVLPHRRT